MANIIIEKLRERIQNPHIAGYFAEVLSCYYSGNMRSAVVMLYSTVICDLIYKLEELCEIYGDEDAKNILDKIEKQQESNPKSTTWESNLPEECARTKKILTDADLSNFIALQQLRHLCAHPVLKGDKTLYKPNPDIVLGHIRNMLEGVLAKPAFHTGRFYKILIEDIAKIKNILVDPKDFKRYVTLKYLDRLNNVDLEFDVFKRLWKFVFKVDNEDCNQNRKINAYMLVIMLERHTDAILNRIKDEGKYFAKNFSIEDNEVFMVYLKMANEFSGLYDNLPDEKKIEIDAKIKKDKTKGFIAMAIFKAGNIVNHIMERIDESHNIIKYLAGYLERNAGKECEMKYYVRLYSESFSYDSADDRFDDFIEPNLEAFSLGQLTEIMNATDSNGQISGRRRAKGANDKIKEQVLKLDPKFDFSAYPNFQ